jgi:molybdopterin-biosynthesis enzyme MoeA-like protein
MGTFFRARGKELNAARLRMATLPVGAQVLYTPDLWVPLVNLNSVFILPGIPRLFQGMIEQHKALFQGPAHVSAALYTHLGEGDLAQLLGDIADKHPKVTIGSYPNTADVDESFRVRLQFESRDLAALNAAVAEVEASFETFRMKTDQV